MGRRKQENRLSTSIADDVDRRVAALDEIQLKMLIRECDALTKTNCGWIEYQLGPILREIAEGYLSVLERPGPTE